MFRILSAGLAFLVFSVPATAASQSPAGIVLVIADGTSQELITASRIYAYGAEGRLELESFAQTAIVRTHSREDVVTDSGAASTAMARGVKADNRVVGLATPKSKVGPPSLLELARKAGWSTGVVTDDSVTGATPAAFLVEHPSRWEEAQIASKIVSRLGPRADIVLGGGAKWFYDLGGKPDVKYEPGQREIVGATRTKLADSKIAAFKDWRALTDFITKGGDGRPVLGTFYPTEFPYYADRNRMPRIADMAVAAVTFLRAKDRPFFLMVEAGLPDKACHRGQAKRAVIEVLELDHMIAELRRNLPRGTLLLVTTDHNTGGLTINGPPVPLAIKGDALMGENPIVAGMSILTWATGPGGNLAKSNLRQSVTSPTDRKLPADPDYQQPAAIESAASLHTGGDVWLLGEGPGSERVHGYLDNTDIYEIIASEITAREEESLGKLP